jgi:hypothetical protein
MQNRHIHRPGAIEWCLIVLLGASAVVKIALAHLVK